VGVALRVRCGGGGGDVACRGGGCGGCGVACRGGCMSWRLHVVVTLCEGVVVVVVDVVCHNGGGWWCCVWWLLHVVVAVACA
jgi:hypothetical protein